MTITQSDLKSLEKFAENLFLNFRVKKEMIFHFTNHFSDDRINDSRNEPLITIQELKDILTKFKKAHIDALYKLVDGQSYVVQCGTTKINIVFAIEEEISKGNHYHRNIAVTIMRKEDWKPYGQDIIFNI